MLKLNVDRLKNQIGLSNGFQTAGKLRSVAGTITADLSAAMGELCQIHSGHDACWLAEVIETSPRSAKLMTFHHTSGLAPGMEVTARGDAIRIPVGQRIIGRVIDALGTPLDGLGPLGTRSWRTFSQSAPPALSRPRITKPLPTGQRSIDGLLTLGQGQRMGLFAGSGVGKSTLLGEIAKHAESDANVIVLVGERGREVAPFLEDCLGDQGQRRSIVIVATSEETALMKIQAVRTGITIAESLRDEGANVLFLLDSLTRLATAQKEVGLARGEIPGTRGYPASVATMIASFLERLGTNPLGSITGLITVLVEGDDMDEPVADTARSILDGHIILSRQLASKGHFPAIDVLQSLSRVFRDVTTIPHQQTATTVRELLAQYQDVSELLRVGLYQQGASPQIDHAIEMVPQIESFLKQRIGEATPFTSMLSQFQQLTGGLS